MTSTLLKVSERVSLGEGRGWKEGRRRVRETLGNLGWRDIEN